MSGIKSRLAMASYAACLRKLGAFGGTMMKGNKGFAERICKAVAEDKGSAENSPSWLDNWTIGANRENYSKNVTTEYLTHKISNSKEDVGSLILELGLSIPKIGVRASISTFLENLG